VLKLIEFLPVQFRILYRQFLLRVIDLEALSIQADIPRFLGQFASILVLLSLSVAMGLLMSDGALPDSTEAHLGFAWHVEQGLISGTMLVVGLISVVSWDSTFPDRTDAMVLSPLPVAPRNILLAKVSASASILGLAVLALNFATGIALPLVAGSQHQSNWGLLQSFGSYWLTMAAASAFIYCSVLTVQGFSSLLFPRWLFLRLSAMMQVIAFGLVLGIYFLQPAIITPASLEKHRLLSWSPSLWFFVLFNQLNGSLPAPLAWLTRRAWIGLATVFLGAAASLWLCYLHTMRKTVEEPDLVKNAWASRWAPRFGSRLHTAIVLFSIRSLLRSRQHRLAFAFYLALISSVALYWLRVQFSTAGRHPLDAGFLLATFMMMSFAVFGLRSVFSLPISLTANWVLRTTQLWPSEKYLAATRRTVLVLAVVPAWLISALLSLSFKPLPQVAVHLAVLALIGWVFAEIALIGFYKVPFTCSYLPGKVHVQVVFGGFLVLLFVLGMTTSDYELPALKDPIRCVLMTSIAATLAMSLWAFNRYRAKSAVLYFEDLPPDVITTLGVASIQLLKNDTVDSNLKNERTERLIL
jgi:hypothetical protein